MWVEEICMLCIYEMIYFQKNAANTSNHLKQDVGVSAAFLVSASYYGV